MQTKISDNQLFWIWLIITGTIIMTFAMAPQIDLWISRGSDWKGIYATTDFDESFYATYLQGLIDGKPRRHIPYSSDINTPEKPLAESQLSIQMAATYPSVWIAQIFGLSISNLMILIGVVVGFISGGILFWLIYQFTEDALTSCVGTLTVLFGGAILAEQGLLYSLIFNPSVHYFHSLIVMRLYLPAVAFPALFLFFIFVWKFFTGETSSAKFLNGFISFCSFTYCVYSYFYFWTTALAWFCGLLILWLIFRFEDFRKNIFYIVGLGLSLILSLIPYAILLSNRESSTDAAIHLKFTRQLDLFQLPEIVSYFTIFLLIIFIKVGYIHWKDSKTIFLTSFALVAPIVLNQQLLTGAAMQPYHYRFFCANYISLFSLFCLVFCVLKENFSNKTFQRITFLILIFSSFVGISDTVTGAILGRDRNIARDKFYPIAMKLKELSENSESSLTKKPAIIFSFDLTSNKYFYGNEIPSLTSQAVMWDIHLNLLPKKENNLRLNKFLYFHNFDENIVREQLNLPNILILLGYFDGERMSKLYTGSVNPITTEEKEKIVSDYAIFRKNFSYQDAKEHEISFVLISKTGENDLSAIDRWYEREEVFNDEEFIIFRVRLRNP